MRSIASWACLSSRASLFSGVGSVIVTFGALPFNAASSSSSKPSSPKPSNSFGITVLVLGAVVLGALGPPVPLGALSFVSPVFGFLPKLSNILSKSRSESPPSSSPDSPPDIRLPAAVLGLPPLGPPR